MYRNVLQGFVIALVAMLPLSTLVIAAEKKTVSQTVSGTISEVNMQKAMLTLKTTEGKTMNLKVAKNLLGGLKTGDQVKVEMTGKKVQAIHKEPMGKQG